MFERFTEPARRAVILGQEEARALGHAHIGTEHLLLGLLREDEGVAARALAALGITPEAARRRVREAEGEASEPGSAGEIGFTAPARRALESAVHEATRRRDRHVGTEHLLLGLTREPESPGAEVLVELCGDLEAVRAAVEAALTGRSRGMPAPAPRPNPSSELGVALQRAAAAASGRPVDGADLLVGLAEAGGVAAAVLAELGVDREGLRRAVAAARRK